MVGTQIIPNNSLVDLEDTLFTSSDPAIPTNANGHDRTLACVTDLEDCCESPQRGSWYFPDGSLVTNTGDRTFWVSRGQKEILNGRQFYGSVRIFRRGFPRSADSTNNRGHFRCELPSAADPSVNQTLYANIGEF